MKLIPKNWKSFQHYNKRNPPWIKLHRSLLDDYEFSMLPVESRALAPMLWLIASETKDGCIQTSSEALAFRLRSTIEYVEKAIKPLVLAGFFIDASIMLATCLRDATPETEGETEGESLPGREHLSKNRDSRATDWTEELEAR